MSLTIVGRGTSSKLNIAVATVLAVGAKRIARVSVLVAGSAPGTVNDAATTGSTAAANAVFIIPNTVGIYDVDWPVFAGIVVTPGTGQTVSVSFVI